MNNWYKNTDKHYFCEDWNIFYVQNAWMVTCRKDGYSSLIEKLEFNTVEEAISAVNHINGG